MHMDRAELSSAIIQEMQALVGEALGATLSDETARRLAEQLGAVAAAQTQAAITRAQLGQPVWATVWATAQIQSAHDTATLAVEVDGVLVHQQAGWQEMKVVTVAPLGPELHTDPQSGRTYLAWGAARYGVGTEEAEAFWWRFMWISWSQCATTARIVDGLGWCRVVSADLTLSPHFRRTPGTLRSYPPHIPAL
jgi:hypothetical protein